METQIAKTNAYLIGGGSYDGDTGRMARHHEDLIQHAKEVFNVERPRVTVFPAARRNGLHEGIRDWSVYQRDFENHGADVSELLIGRIPSGGEATPESQRAELITGAHVIWVPGGDTQWMLEDIRNEGLEEEFQKAREAGVVISGTSAGALWAFGRGVSDSESFSTPESWRYIEIEGLGLVSQAAMNVHDNKVTASGLQEEIARADRFDGMLENHSIPRGLALDEHTALQIVNGQARIQIYDPKDQAHLVSLEGGKAKRQKLEEGDFDLAQLSF
ncbi:Type 1 glutamine amidotransferase-like domain-containing protein [bacterium]|nr:Type 1 glutamine amidotransferase-like domain-containing protein [bacterium]